MKANALFFTRFVDHADLHIVDVIIHKERKIVRASPVPHDYEPLSINIDHQWVMMANGELLGDEDWDSWQYDFEAQVEPVGGRAREILLKWGSDTGKERITKIITMYCSVCGAVTRGRQWWNRDTGHGLCQSCGNRLPTERNVPLEEMLFDYGLRGIHYYLGE